MLVDKLWAKINSMAALLTSIIHVLEKSIHQQMAAKWSTGDFLCCSTCIMQDLNGTNPQFSSKANILFRIKHQMALPPTF